MYSIYNFILAVGIHKYYSNNDRDRGRTPRVSEVLQYSNNNRQKECYIGHVWLSLRIVCSIQAIQEDEMKHIPFDIVIVR